MHAFVAFVRGHRVLLQLWGGQAGFHSGYAASGRDEVPCRRKAVGGERDLVNNRQVMREDVNVILRGDHLVLFPRRRRLHSVRERHAGGDGKHDWEAENDGHILGVFVGY